jgi:ubiquinol-cytochrome c reductase cytochrome b subunit
LFLLPWLDRSPVKSIRYRGPLFRFALVLFIISFLVLGFLGTQPVTPLYTLMSQVFTIVYFAFFILMPFYTAVDKDKPVPERVTFK